MIYAFRSWRVELDRLANDLRTTIDHLNNLERLKPEKAGILKQAAFGSLVFEYHDSLLKSFLLSALILRKMDDAAKYPFPAGKMKASKLDRQLAKRLKDYSFESYVGAEEGGDQKSVRIIEGRQYSGRDVSNLAIHSEEMRLFDFPYDEQNGFWIRSDERPDKDNSKLFWFLNLDDYLPMLDDFRHDPWKD